MMKQIVNPFVAMIGGVVLVFLGFGLVFGMVIRLIETTFLLGFLAYACSLVGLLAGIVGALQYRQGPRW